MDKIPFGSTGHMSSRILFGAAALGGMKQSKADATLQMVMDAGINHIDTAASYGDSELRLADFLADHRNDVFLATKTGDRDGDGARASIERSLERMQVDSVDMIQFHNLAQDDQWEVAMGPGGALEAAITARDEGLVKFIGVTGHGTRIAEMHLKSLDRFEFAAVLLPYNQMMMKDAQYVEEFETLHKHCMDKGIAMQTIKSIAKRRWREDDPSPKFSWYEPIRDTAALTRAVHWVLRRPGVFLNSSSDATLLPATVEAANSFDPAVAAEVEASIAADVDSQALEPLFERGVMDDVRLS